MSFSPKQLFRLAEHVSFTQVEDESVLLDLRNGGYYGLNHVGTRLLEHIRNNDELGVAIKTISLEYQTLESLVESDIEKLLAQLVEQRLLDPIK